ncbi:MAG: LysM peptidoglycan-binding domain-containing M23 family metallopeptidase [Chloroflexota bacterium]
MAQIPEPPFHDDDTSPSIAIRPVDLDESIAQSQQASTPQWQRAMGVLSLLGAGLFTIATLVVLLLPANNDPSPDIVSLPTEDTATIPTIPADVEIAEPTQVIADENPAQTISDDVQLPAVNADQLASILTAPIAVESPLQRLRYNPYTVVNTERARSDFIDYTVVQGDTIGDIAIRYGLQPESIAWCNDRRVVVVLRPGDVLRIPPVDGACHEVFGSRDETIEQIAIQYNIEDPYAIIDAEFNRNQLPPNLSPTDRLLGGTDLFIPNGEGPVITWNESTEEVDASGNVIGVGFANGQAGSCGSVTPSSFVGWLANPLPNGTWVRGFFAGHSGIDLSASSGTPIYAASSGNVLFSGFSRWGYGNAVVLEHGSTYKTLYGHMVSTPAVRCGDFVSAGTIIGYVGSTGQSSGPHLHFEIQVNGTAVNPSGTPGIGW